MASLKKTVLSTEEQEITRKALGYIEALTRLAKERGMRLVVGGGYAVDGFLEEITRPHADIDLHYTEMKSMVPQ